MVYIYILCLENGKYYVGRTNNIDIRIDKHFNSNGSYWTMKYKPISIEHIYANRTVYDEDKYTIEMMAKHGIDNVRGGSFTKIILPENEKQLITKMINNASDKCFNCGDDNHFTTKCPYDNINNYNMLILKYKFIAQCLKYEDNTVPINELKDILIDIDNKIFKNIIENDILKLCKRINKRKFKGVDEIEYENINYMDFINGLIMLFDGML